MNLGQIKGNCQAETPLTGSGSCPKQEGKVSALIVTGLNALYPMDQTEFSEALSGYVSDPGVLRMYPVKDIVGMTLSGGDINAPDLGTYGGPAPTNLNAKNVAYQINAGDCLYKELAKFNKRKMRLFRVDDQGYIYGTVVVRGGVEYFAGFEVTLYAVRTPTDGSTAYNLSLYAYYTPNNEAEEKNMNAFEVGLANVPDGLLGVVLKKGATGLTATVETVCGGEDVTAEYGDKWTTDMFLNNSGSKPTTVTFSSDTGLLTFAPAGSYRVASAKVLEAGDIVGLEGVDQFVALSE